MPDKNTEIQKLYASHFDALRQVYDRALDNHQFDTLVVYSGEIKKRFQDDIDYPFFVNVQFKAIVPLTNVPESWIIWRPSDRPLLLLYQPNTVWDVVHELPDTFWSAYFDIIPLKKKEDSLSYFSGKKHCAFLGESTSLNQQWELGERNPESLIAELNWYRVYKTPYEQFCIQQANRITVLGHKLARETFYSGGSELEIALAFQQACLQTEEALAFPSTIAINEHAGILHYSARETNPIKASKRHSFLIDAGASFNGYASDTCRTYAYRDGLFAELISALDTVQQATISRLKVGYKYSDSALTTLRELAGILRDYGIIKLEPDTTIELDLIKYFMPHNISHFLGLQVHDVGANQLDVTGTVINEDHPRHKMLRTIEANQVLTVEPGIYFIDSLLTSLSKTEHSKSIDWDLVETLRPCGGMRIEDNILITLEGPVNFTRQALAELPS